MASLWKYKVETRRIETDLKVEAYIDFMENAGWSLLSVTNSAISNEFRYFFRRAKGSN